jgi:hypothetical protein
MGIVLLDIRMPGQPDRWGHAGTLPRRGWLPHRPRKRTAPLHDRRSMASAFRCFFIRSAIFHCETYSSRCHAALPVQDEAVRVARRFAQPGVNQGHCEAIADNTEQQLIHENGKVPKAK